VPGYVFRLLPPRPTFRFDMSPAEREVMFEHVGYWSDLAARDKVLAFGPVDDPVEPYGIGIVVADGLAQAEAIRDQDPAMRSGRGFRTEIALMARLVTPEGTLDGIPGTPTPTAAAEPTGPVS
jgi:uncharacterized protein